MNTKTKNILLIVLGVAVIGMTVAFAALSSQLKIEGTASVPNTSWNIHFQEWDDNTNETVTYGGNEHANTAVYPSAESLTKTLSPNITKVEGLNVTLYQPGDYASYTFQIINEGSIDASLDSFDKNLTCASGNDCSHLSYTVECVDSQNNNVLTGNPTLPKNGGLAYCTLTVTYTDQTNQNSGTAGQNQVYTQSAASAELDATWVYVQKLADNSGNGSGSGSGSGSNSPSYTYYGSGIFTENPTGYDFDYEDYQEPSNNNQCPSGYAYYEGDSEYSAGCYYVYSAYCDNGDYNDSTGKCEYEGEGELQDISEKDVYIRDDGEIKETCGIFPNGFVCMTSSYYNSDYSSSNNYNSDFENVSGDFEGITATSGLVASGLKGYALTKATEMLSNGVSSCFVENSQVGCDKSNDGDGTCYIEADGDAYCSFDSDNECHIKYDGSTVCYY